MTPNKSANGGDPGSGLQISFLATQTTPDSISISPFQITSRPVREARNEI